MEGKEFIGISTMISSITSLVVLPENRNKVMYKIEKLLTKYMTFRVYLRINDIDIIQQS